MEKTKRRSIEAWSASSRKQVHGNLEKQSFRRKIFFHFLRMLKSSKFCVECLNIATTKVLGFVNVDF